MTNMTVVERETRVGKATVTVSKSVGMAYPAARLQIAGHDVDVVLCGAKAQPGTGWADTLQTYAGAKQPIVFYVSPAEVAAINAALAHRSPELAERDAWQAQADKVASLSSDAKHANSMAQWPRAGQLHDEWLREQAVLKAMPGAPVREDRGPL